MNYLKSKTHYATDCYFCRLLSAFEKTISRPKSTVLKLFSKDLTRRKETWDVIFIFKPQLDITINDCLTFGRVNHVTKTGLPINVRKVPMKLLVKILSFQ